MKTNTVLCLMAAAAFLCTAVVSNAADQQRDRLQLHTDDPLYLQQQDRDRLHIYADKLMSPEEKALYRNEYYELKTEQERERFRHRHEIRMRARADAQGIRLSDPVTTQQQERVNQDESGRTGGKGYSGNSGGPKQGGSSSVNGGGRQGGSGGGGGRK